MSEALRDKETAPSGGALEIWADILCLEKASCSYERIPGESLNQNLESWMENCFHLQQRRISGSVWRRLHLETKALTFIWRLT